MARQTYDNNFLRFPWKVVGGLIVAFVFIMVLLVSIVIVPAGHRGVVLYFGAVENRVLSEGLHFITPVAESAQIMEVRTQKYEVACESASKDLLDVQTSVAVNFHVEPGVVNTLYQNLGLDYTNRVIAPNVQEVVKAVTAKFDAQGLISTREQVKSQIEDALKERLTARGIVVETISITNFKFPAQFNDAITAKQTADQEAQKASNVLKRIEIEAAQKIASARGDSEAIRIINEQLKQSPQYVQLLAVQKWDSHLPLVVGSSVPFVNIPMTAIQEE